MERGDIMGWAVWFLYACTPPLFFFCWWLWRRHVERPGYCASGASGGTGGGENGTTDR
jgi:hypothetical protein